VPFRVTGAESAVELERAECDEKDRWKDVDQGEERVAGEDVVGGGELGEGGICRCGWRMVAVEEDGDQAEGAAGDYGEAYETEENRGGPEKLLKTPHIVFTREARGFFRGKLCSVLYRSGFVH
jgi:hypothetical protein